MAFNRDNLARTSSSGNTNAPQEWSYTTTDSYATVSGTDYFLAAIREIHKNDIIKCVTSTGTTAVVTITYMETLTEFTSNDIAAGVTVTA
jgi:hypothetical protein